MSERARRAICGLYAVTPDERDTNLLVAQVDAAIAGGACCIQYRHKSASDPLRREQARMLRALCRTREVIFIVNDHIALAREVDADGVHIGADDGAIEDARQGLGRGKLIGVSCYDRLDQARRAAAQGADYVAFGSFFPSTVKPGAVRASFGLIAQARLEIDVPIVAIGGVSPENAREVIDAGADAIAVISALFGAPDIREAARRFTGLFVPEARP